MWIVALFYKELSLNMKMRDYEDIENEKSIAGLESTLNPDIAI